MTTKNIIAIVLFVLAIGLHIYLYYKSVAGQTFLESFVKDLFNFVFKQQTPEYTTMQMVKDVIDLTFLTFFIFALSVVFLLLSLVLGWDLKVLRFSILAIFIFIILRILILEFTTGERAKYNIEKLTKNSCINSMSIALIQMFYQVDKAFYMNNNLEVRIYPQSKQLVFHKNIDFEGKDFDSRDFIAKIHYEDEVKFLTPKKYSKEQNKKDKALVEKGFCEVVKNSKNCLTLENFELVKNYIEKHKMTGNINPEKNRLLRISNSYAFEYTNDIHKAIGLYKNWQHTRGYIYIDNGKVIVGYVRKVQNVVDNKILKYEFCRLVNKIKRERNNAKNS